jgi:O-antigen/teichoic acid export membrane protein
MTLLSTILRGEGLFARALRGSGWTTLGFAAAQAIRLGANLVLTRLLFPEAFGVMALVTVFLVGLAQFSDIGIGASILQNRRGDDPDFLDTAWTLQVLRGALLWLATCALAWPVALLYGEPMLAELLPVAGLALLVAGFNPTRLETANRHLALGRVTGIEVASQAIGVAVMIALAFATGSVWALVAGGVVTALAKLGLAHAALPGHVDRFRWHPVHGRELVHFGKWIFLSTACSFVITQGDRAILGVYLPLGLLGIYNIGFFLGSFAINFADAIVWKILIPLYRERPPAESAENYAKIRRMRMGLTGAMLPGLLLMAFIGVPLVELLYDPRYAAAGAVVVLIACVQIPRILGLTYDQAALAAGDSRGYFLLVATKATVQTALFLAGAELAGLVGALAGQGLALVLTYPAVIWLARRHGAWDPRHDGLFALLGGALGGLALWLNRDAIAALAALAP